MCSLQGEPESIREKAVPRLHPPGVRAVIYTENIAFVTRFEPYRSVYNSIYYCEVCGKELCRIRLFPDPKCWSTYRSCCAACQETPRDLVNFHLQLWPKKEQPIEFLAMALLLNTETSDGQVTNPSP